MEEILPVQTRSGSLDHEEVSRPLTPNFNVGKAPCVQRGGRFKWNKFCQLGSRSCHNIEIGGGGRANLSFARDTISDSEATGETRGANWQNLFHQLSGWVRKGTIVVELLIKLGDRFFFLLALLSVNYGIVCGRKACVHDTGRKTSRPRNALRSPHLGPAALGCAVPNTKSLKA